MASPQSVGGMAPGGKSRRRTKRDTQASSCLAGPGLIRLRIRGREGDLESLNNFDANVVSKHLKR